MLSIVQLSRFDAVLRCFSRDSYIRLSQLSSFVNNFFKLFFAVVFVISLSLDSSVRLPYLSFLVNNFFDFFIKMLFIVLILSSNIIFPKNRAVHLHNLSSKSSLSFLQHPISLYYGWYKLHLPALLHHMSQDIYHNLIPAHPA